MRCATRKCKDADAVIHSPLSHRSLSPPLSHSHFSTVLGVRVPASDGPSSHFLCVPTVQSLGGGGGKIFWFFLYPPRRNRLRAQILVEQNKCLARRTNLACFVSSRFPFPFRILDTGNNSPDHMLRQSLGRLMGMGAWSMSERQQSQNDKRSWKELFWKPETRDERIKQFVPEVLEESLAAQKSVLSAEQNQRDRIVEAGHKVLKELENKAPIPTLYPSLLNILKLYGVADRVVSQRALNYLLYPSSSSFAGHVPHELVGGFQDNFKHLIDHVEVNGSAATSRIEALRAEQAAAKADAKSKAEEKASADAIDFPSDATPTTTAVSGTTDGGVADPKKDNGTVGHSGAEDPEVTYFVKCVAGMGLANVHIGDFANAVSCVDAALTHAVDDNRRAGLLALKAGVLNKMKRYDEAIAAAQLCVAANPMNSQGYLQGAAALRLSKRDDEAVAFLESGSLNCAGNELVRATLEATKKVATLSLGAGGVGAAAGNNQDAAAGTKSPQLEAAATGTAQAAATA